MILIASREEKELLERLRKMDATAQAGVLAQTVIDLKKQIVELEIARDKQLETNAHEDRELRHMIGLEKKRQEVEITQAKKETELLVREGNLQADKKRFEEQLAFNTKRFEKMEEYLKGMLDSILARLPHVNVELGRGKK